LYAHQSMIGGAVAPCPHISQFRTSAVDQP
jgi:hypothetical protein